MSWTRPVAVVAALVVLVLGTAGCTGTPDDPPSTSRSASASRAPTVTTTVTATASAVPTATAGPRTDPDAPKGQCADSALSISEQPDPDGGGAGHIGSYVVFRNVGSSSCVLEGAPGVSIVGHGNGTQLGHAAARVPGARTPLVTLAPNGTAIAPVDASVVDAKGGIYADGNGGDPQCEAEQGDGYRVYAPHSFTAVFVRASVYACTTDVVWMHVSPVVASVTGFTPED